MMDPTTREELFELFRRVAKLERKLDFILRELKLDFKDAEDLSSLVAKVQEILRNGTKIQAIQVYQMHTQKGLKESKDAVEQIEKQMKMGK